MDPTKDLVKQIDEINAILDKKDADKAKLEPEPTLREKLNGNIEQMIESMRSEEANGLRGAIVDAGKAFTAGFASLKELLGKIEQKEKEFPDSFDVRVQNKVSISNLKDIPKAVFPKEIQVSKPNWLSFITEPLKQIKESLDTAQVKKDEAAAYSLAIDKKSASKIYLGYAKPGTQANESAWRIKRIETMNDGTTECLYAKGSGKFEHRWDKRKVLDYL